MVRLSSRNNEIEDTEDDSCEPSCFGATQDQDPPNSPDRRRSTVTSAIHAKKKQLDYIWTVHALVAGENQCNPQDGEIWDPLTCLFAILRCPQE